MTPPGTFERVYAAIRQRLRQGTYRPGERLEPAILSEELNSSVTPIRDALHRLTGERLVEAPRHEGFRAPMMTETLLRHLYGWHRDLLLMAMMNHGSAARAGERIPDEAGAEGEVEEWQSALFRALARSTGNPEHVAALDAVGERLGPARRFENFFLDAVEPETAQIVEALESNDRKALRRSLLSYHRRRQRIVPQLLARLLEN